MTLPFLRLLTWLGWGQHPDDLRARAELNLSLVPRTLIGLAGFVVFLSGLALALVWNNSERARIVPEIVHDTILGAAVLLLITVVGLLLPALSSRILARRSQPDRPTTVYGRCFATLPDPYGLFPGGRLYARIGLSPDPARWYLLPLEWDTYIQPSSTELELTVIEGCGCVERVRRLGPNPRDLRLADLDTENEAGMSLVEMRQAADTAIDAAASPQERTALRRFVRHAGMAARYPASTILASSWSLLLFGALLGPIMVIAFAIAVVCFPRSFRDPGGRGAGLVFSALFLMVGVALIVYGVHLFRAGRLAHATRHESPVVVTGKVISWMPYRELQTSTSRQLRTETVIRIRLSDNATHIFCIARAYLHRVREIGAPVRVAYLPSTGRVVDVRRQEEPDEASLQIDHLRSDMQ
jgi:hypothetical protein